MKTVKGKSLCVYSPKGGLGKTTLVANLGAVASVMGKKVLLIDFDLYFGCLSMFINENITKTLFNLTDDLNNNRYKSINDYVYKYNDNIDILCAPKDPRQGSKIDSKYIDIVLERVSGVYDLVIIDTYSNSDEITVSILDVVDNILFMIDNDPFTLKNVRNMINIFKDNEITNYKVMLNSFLTPKIDYFSNAEIKKIIGSNIDYTLSRNFFIKEISSSVYDNTIPILYGRNYKKHKSDIRNMELIIKEITGGDDDEKK